MDRRTVGFRLAFTTQELADACGLDVRYVRKVIKRGEIPAFKLGAVWMIRRESFDAWMVTQEQRSMRLRKPAGRADVTRRERSGDAVLRVTVTGPKENNAGPEGRHAVARDCDPDQPAASV
jgi:excisionase family DNA binding protein